MSTSTSAHDATAVSAGWCTFVDSAGERLVQVDTYGSAGRAIPGKTSQSIQLDRASAEALLRIINEVFPGLSA